MINEVLSDILLCALVGLVLAYGLRVAINYIREGITMKNLRELIAGILIVLICVCMVLAIIYAKFLH